jgi:hypothetical protein
MFFFKGKSRSSTIERADSTSVPLPNRRTSLDATVVADVRMETEYQVGETIYEEGAAEAENYPVWCVALYDYQVNMKKFLPNVFDLDLLQFQARVFARCFCSYLHCSPSVVARN